MGKTLFRTAQVAIVILALQGAAWKANALAVECAGCVAAIEKTTAAVNTGNATLAEIKALLTTVVNHLNQIRLAVGPVVTTSSVGTLAQKADFQNLMTIAPDFKGFDLKKGVKIDLGDLGGLKEDVTTLLQITTNAAKLKDKIKSGRYLETAADLARVAQRRKSVFSEAVQDGLSTAYYSQNGVQAAKQSELGLDTERRGSGTLQDKAMTNAKIGVEILGRLNHLITQQSMLLKLLSARQLQDLPRDIQGTEDLETPPPVRGTATQLFGGQQ